MQGLRTQEKNSFIDFFSIVQNSAKEIGCVFFLDCEDGDDKTINGIETVSLWGWLIPFGQSEKFEAIWKDRKEDDSWVDFFKLATVSSVDNNIKIHFVD